MYCYISVLVYCPCGNVGSSNRSSISFDSFEDWSAEKQASGHSGGVQSWTSSSEQGANQRRQRKDDWGAHGMNYTPPSGHV